MLVLLFLAMVYSWRRKKSGSLWIYGYAVIDVISLFTILRCPGNGIRSMQEVEGRMPEFAYFSVWEKIYMGAAVICSGIWYPWICTDPHRASVV